MKSTQFNFRITLELRKRIHGEAKKLRITDAQFVRRQLIRYFDEMDFRKGLRRH
jgi:predicted DNA-binding protein